MCHCKSKLVIATDSRHTSIHTPELKICKVEAAMTLSGVMLLLCYAGAAGITGRKVANRFMISGLITNHINIHATTVQS
jgi:hypothetical protein